MKRVATIGVYGWTRERFLDALRDADVGLLVDVRQRRGVRGREYAWANAARLQEALAAAGVRHHHPPPLPPAAAPRPPPRARPGGGAPPPPVRRRPPPRRRQALARRAGARLRRALHARGARPR